jgi:hypothetical protein
MTRDQFLGELTMPDTNKAELIAELADLDLRIHQTAARISDRHDDRDWKLALDQIVELRKLRQELEAKIASE